MSQMTLNHFITNKLASMNQTPYTIENHVDEKTYNAIQRITTGQVEKVVEKTAQRLAAALKINIETLRPFIGRAKWGTSPRFKKRKSRAKPGSKHSQIMRAKWAKLREAERAELKDTASTNGAGHYMILDTKTGEVVARF